MSKFDKINRKKCHDTAEYLAELDRVSKFMKREILDAIPEYDDISGEKYYVSPNGNDLFDGKSKDSAWRTLDKVNSFEFNRGDCVLFEKNGMWRGGIVAQSGVTYSNYGEGELPLINGSKQNYADPDLWLKTEYENVYLCTKELNNVGIIAFDHSKKVGIYDEKVGKILFHNSYDEDWYKDRGIESLNESCLCEDLEFYSDIQNKKLYLKSIYGNPGERFKSIEIGEHCYLFKLGADWHGDNITVDGLQFRYCGAHAINGGGEGSGNITVKNCIFAYLGGSVMDHDPNKNKAGALFGNAVQIYGTTHDLTVENNWCYQIFDTGITFQTSGRSDKDVNYRNIRIKNNLIEYCHWSIEYYAQKRDGRMRRTENVDISENFCRYGGMGWGSIRRYKMYSHGNAKAASAALLCSWGITDDTENFNVKHNIFDRCTGWLGLVYLPSPLYGEMYGDKKVNFGENQYIQYSNENFCRLFGMTYTFENAEGAIKNLSACNDDLCIIV